MENTEARKLLVLMPASGFEGHQLGYRELSVNGHKIFYTFFFVFLFAPFFWDCSSLNERSR